MNLHPISEGRVHESLKWFGKSGTRKLVPPGTEGRVHESLKSYRKSGTRKLVPPRFMVPMRVKMKWRLSMNLEVRRVAPCAPSADD